MGVCEEMDSAIEMQYEKEAEQLRDRVTMLERERFKLRLLSVSLATVAVICFWIVTA